MDQQSFYNKLIKLLNLNSGHANLTEIKSQGNLMNFSFLKDNTEKILYVTASGAQITFGYFLTCILTLIIAGWIIFLNALVIQTLLYHKRHPEVTDYFVSSLSIADLVTGIVLLYVTTYSLAQYQNFWECLFRFGLTYGVSQSAFNHILAITIDRYIKIIFPLRYFSMFSRRTVIITSSTIWSLSILVGLLPLLGWHKDFKLANNKDTVCRFFGVMPDSYFIFNFLTSMGTSAAMLILYIQIIRVALRQQKQMEELMEGYRPAQSRVEEHTWNLVKTVAIIVLVSNLCWLPGVVVIALHIFKHLDYMSYDDKGDLITYCGLAMFLNSLINPLIYASKIEDVKKRFALIFCCREAQRRRVLSTTSQQEEALQSSLV